MVPLERNTVRFIDNFSTGTRAAACTEWFIAQGYRVIHLSRSGSTAPFTRHLTACIGKLDSPDALGSLIAGGAGASSDNVCVDATTVDRDALERLSHAIRSLQQAQRDEAILHASFTSLTDYLFLLRAVCRELSFIGNRALLFLAAAVSDFYIPESAMQTHKIQSAAGPLVLSLQQSPKALSNIFTDCAPRAFAVSFKLETDNKILLMKANRAIDKYGVDLVVANQLHTRYQRVLLVCKSLDASGKRETVAIEKQPGHELDEHIVEAVVQRHARIIGK